MHQFKRIIINPEQCNGQLCIHDMRITVANVVSMLAAGMSEDEILTEHPSLEREDIRESLLYAAEPVRR